MVPSETVESATLEHSTFCLLLFPVTDIFYHTMYQQTLAHFCCLFLSDTAVQRRKAVGKQAVYHSVTKETVVESLQVIEVTAGLKIGFQVRDNLAVHDSSWESTFAW